MPPHKRMRWCIDEIPCLVKSNHSTRFQRLKSRYSIAYQKHHRDTYKAVRDLQARLADGDRRLRVLALLNSIQELGSPIGEDLAERYGRLQERLRLCPITEVAAVTVDVQPCVRRADCS